jgi:transcriptional regulator with XRE-family HTH domain
MVGDSFISKDITGKGGSDQTFVDGHKNKSLLKYSKEYLENLSKLIKKLYKTNSSVKKLKNANAYQLGIHCKWFSRYHHFIYDFPLGEKANNLKVPNILNFLPQKIKMERLRFFWKGIFDTDGTYHSLKPYISLSSRSKNLIKSFKEFASQINIKTSELLPGKNRSYQVNIYVESIFDFIRFIGSIHPRRRQIIKYYILKGPKRKVFKGLNKNLLYKGYFDLEILGKNIRVSNVSKYVKSLRKDLKLSQSKLANLIGCRQQDIERYENGKRNIQLSLLLKIGILKGLTKEDICRLVENCNSELAIGENFSIRIRLPIKPASELNDIAKFLRPSKNMVRVLSEFVKKKKVEKIFGIRIKQDSKGAYYINCKTLSDFLKTFYIYELPWYPRK